MIFRFANMVTVKIATFTGRVHKVRRLLQQPFVISTIFGRFSRTQGSKLKYNEQRLYPVKQGLVQIILKKKS